MMRQCSCWLVWSNITIYAIDVHNLIFHMLIFVHLIFLDEVFLYKSHHIYNLETVQIVQLFISLYHPLLCMLKSIPLKDSVT